MIIKTIMKAITFLGIIIFPGIIFSGCQQISYRKTASGMPYKIFPGNGKDSLIRFGQSVKFNVTQKLNDSVLYSSYGKMPGYARVLKMERAPYNLLEILPLMKKGDSAVTIQIVDTLLKRGAQLPPTVKKGDRIITTFRITDVFSSDSVAMADYNKEMERDKPRQMKEQEEQIAAAKKQMEEQQKKEDEELERSGEKAKELKEIEQWLSAKKISAQKTGQGVYVHIDEPGNGPAAVDGKYVSVKYTGKILNTDSAFQSSSYTLQLGKGEAIKGWDQGLLLFKQGGKGTLYIPGFLAYGKNPPPQSPFKPYEALKFDVEIQSVSDTMPAPKSQIILPKKVDTAQHKKK